MEERPPERETADLRAAAIVAVLVAGALVVGVVAGVRARPAPTPAPPASVTTLPIPTAAAVDPKDVERRAFVQPLSAGCATDKAVWLFADGGSAIRFDGRVWSIPDPTLRSLTAAACRSGTALAVGGGGSLLTADDDRRELRTDHLGTDDLRGVAILPDGAIAVGSSGAVLRQSALDWTQVGASIVAELHAVAASGRTVWLVGAGGASYHLTNEGWQPVPTLTSATLRAVAIPSVETAIAAGDGGTLLRWTAAGWAKVETAVTSTFRGASVIGAATWIVGDGGTVIEVLGDRIRRIDVGTTCTLRAVFPQDTAVWIVGSDGVRGGAWRITPSGTERWGSC